MAAIVSPMSGKIVNVFVSEGEKIEEGQVVLVLEAMKMENDVVASEGGTIAKILVKEGQQVNAGEDLITLA